MSNSNYHRNFHQLKNTELIALLTRTKCMSACLPACLSKRMHYPIQSIPIHSKNKLKIPKIGRILKIALSFAYYFLSNGSSCSLCTTWKEHQQHQPPPRSQHNFHVVHSRTQIGQQQQQKSILCAIRTNDKKKTANSTFGLIS